MGSYKLGKKCKECNKLLLDNNKSGYCNIHRDRTGKHNPFYGKKHSKETREKLSKLCRTASKKMWESPAYRKKVIDGVSKPRRDGFKREQSERIRRWYEDNPEQREIRSRSMKKLWKDGILKHTINSINESKIEKELRANLSKAINKKVRKSTIRIGDNRWAYPDVLIGDKDIIEFYGNFWHANPSMYAADDQIHHNQTAQMIWDADKCRVDMLKQIGYNVVIVWEDEYKANKEEVLNNIISKYED